MPSNEPGIARRTLVRGLVAAGIVAAAGIVGSGTGRAQGTDGATALVTALAKDLLALVTSGKSEAQIYSGFEGILSRYADMPAVAASVLGPPWRTASAAQKQAFVAAFQHYLSRRYGKQFRDYQSARIDVTGAKAGGKAGVLVSTKVVRPGKDDISVDWQVSDRSGQPKVVNLIIEGVSMLANERAEVGAVLDAQGGSLDGLVKQLKSTG
ncbi:MAG: ABC transporter substrate-binding protein [Amaricoccus sp.]